MLSCFRERKIYVTREKLRDSVNRVFPSDRQLRLAKSIRRRQYNVDGPHHLWHVDGNHKLIRYNLVIHAGIDGFSRAVMFIKCSDNNRASTVFKAFEEAVNIFGIPSRIRIDKGGENREIAVFMLDNKGLGRGSILAGKSTHNQRIERFWRDARKDVIDYYRNIFQYIESDLSINFDHPICIFVLHYLFFIKNK